MAAEPIRTIVSRRGQTVVPAQIRHRHDIQEGDSLVWLDEGGVIRLVHLRGDAVAMLRGMGRGEALWKRLLAERAADKKRGS